MPQYHNPLRTECYPSLRYEITYTRFAKRQIDQFRDQRIACAVAAHLARRILATAVNVYETARAANGVLYQRLITSIRPE